MDAAVAIAFTLAVTDPDAGNLGGGGFMTFMWTASRISSITLNGRRSGDARMYLDDKGNPIPGMSADRFSCRGRAGHGRWPVGGTRRFGKLKWKQVLAPAIHYATDGFKWTTLAKLMTMPRRVSPARPISTPTLPI